MTVLEFFDKHFVFMAMVLFFAFAVWCNRK